MQHEVLWQDPARRLTVTLTSEPTQAVVDLLERTVWGSRDMRYRICDVREKLVRLADPCIFAAEQDDRLVGVCIVDRKRMTMDGGVFAAAHLAMLAVEDEYRRDGIGTLLVTQIRRFCGERLPPPAVAYAYVESTTEFSLRIGDRVGHNFEATVPLTLFSRWRPRDDERVGPVASDELEEVTRRLRALYASHAFADVEGSLRPSEYYVLREQGRVVVGVQAERLHWSVQALPGRGGEWLMRALRRVAWLRRRLPVDDLYFCRFGNLLCEAGAEPQLTRLLSAVLARRDARAGLIMLDARSPVLARILAHGRLGALGRFVRGAVKVVAEFQGVTPDDVARITAQPIAVSARDVI